MDTSLQFLRAPESAIGSALDKKLLIRLLGYRPGSCTMRKSGSGRRGDGMPRLSLLALDLVEVVLDDDEPDGVSLEKLYGMPVEWEEQRGVVGQGAVRPSR